MATKTANVMARVEPEIKSKAEAIMASLGIPASVVINALYHQVIYTNGIPFPITLPERVPTIENMSKDDFDSMMDSSLTQARKGEGEPVAEVFRSIRSGNSEWINTYFSIDSLNMVIYVLIVVYGKRDQFKQLNELDF